MLRFALDKGQSVSDTLAKQISQVDMALRKHGLQTIAEVPVAVFFPNSPAPPSPAQPGVPVFYEDPLLPNPQPGQPAPGAAQDFTTTILLVHGQLSSLITPVTAQTLIATSSDSGIKLFFNLPDVLKIAMLMAIICSAGFLASMIAAGVEKAKVEQRAAGKSQAEEAGATQPKPTPTETPQPGPPKPN